MRYIQVKKNQTLLDIALQEYGDVEGVFWLVEDNGLNAITERIRTDQKLAVRDNTINIRMRNYLRPYTIVTGETAQGEGIGYWYISDDFVVS